MDMIYCRKCSEYSYDKDGNLYCLIHEMTCEDVINAVKIYKLHIEFIKDLYKKEASK